VEPPLCNISLIKIYSIDRLEASISTITKRLFEFGLFNGKGSLTLFIHNYFASCGLSSLKIFKFLYFLAFAEQVNITHSNEKLELYQKK